jgi:phosphoribosyl 1,2-cyclic phosphate phosphodiesterase
MKITVLGSAAAEGIPSLWCNCETCRQAKLLGGKDIRRRTSYLIDDDTLVDLGPDFLWQVTAFNIDTVKLKQVVYTHSHFDHESPMELRWRCEGFADKVQGTLQLYGNEQVHDFLMSLWNYCTHGHADFSANKCNFNVLEFGVPCQADNLQILPLKANHDTAEKCMLHLLTRNGKTVFISHDTGIYPDETWKLLEGKHIDLAFFDCTGGVDPVFGRNENHHSGGYTDAKLRQRLLEMGCLTEKTPCYVNHFSHNAHSLHHQMEEVLNPLGLQVAYDGLTIEL